MRYKPPAVLTLVVLGAFGIAALAEETLSLDEAMGQGKVEVESRGLGGSTGDTILVYVRRLVPETLHLSLTPGTVFKSVSGGVQDMVGSAIKGEQVTETSYNPTNEIVLRDDARHAYVIEAYCLDFHKENPGPEDSFSISGVDEASAQILAAGKSTGASTKVTQSALWIDREGVGAAQLKERFPVGDDDIAAARDLHSKLQPRNKVKEEPGKPAKAEALAAPGRIKAEEKNESGEASHLKRIPLVIKTLSLPRLGSLARPSKDPVLLLDDVVVLETPDVLAVATGAKVAGWAAGYDFEPLVCLKKGEKAREAVGRLDSDSNVFLLLSVHIPNPWLVEENIGLVHIRYDAALYQFHEMNALFLCLHSQWMALFDVAKVKSANRNSTDDSLERVRVSEGHLSQEKGRYVDRDYWKKITAETFAKFFDEDVLSRIQRALDGDEIARDIVELKAVSTAAPIVPSITALEGGEKKDPELKIAATTVDAQAVAYLEPKQGGLQRKWLTSMGVDSILEPGEYTIYFDTRTGKEEGRGQVYRQDLRIEYKKRYYFSLP